MTETVRRVATYERVSSDDQRERETIKTQTEEIARRLLGDPNLHLIHRYVDDGVSGTIPLAERPAGRRLLEDAARGLFEEVWVLKLDRLGRDDVDPLVVRRDLERLGVKIVAVLENIGSPLEFAIRVAFAAEERRTFLARSAAGMNRAAREGRYCGGIRPYGYRVEGQRHQAKPVPDDTIVWGDMTAAGVMQRMYRRSAIDQWSCPKIAEEFNDLGIPTAYQRDGRGVRGKRTQGKWRAGRIRNMLIQPIYRGELQYGRRSSQPGGREVVTGRVEPLVSDEIWYAAQETLARNRIMAKNTRRVYLLRGIIRCAVCGLTYVGTTSSGTVWYRCDGQLLRRGPVEGRCIAKAVNGHYLQPRVWADVEAFLRDPGTIVHELETEFGGDGQKAIAEAESITLTAALRDLEEQQDRAIDLHIRGRLDAQTLDAQLDRIASDRAEIERRLATLHTDMAEEEPPLTPDILAELRRRLDEGLSDEERQEIVRLLVRITVHTEIRDGKKHARAVVEYRFPSVGETFTGTGSWPKSA